MNQIIEKYLRDHNLTPQDAENFGLKISDSLNKISIPIKDADGKILFWKSRHFDPGPKYKYDRGATVQLFGFGIKASVFRPTYIVEGEMDAMALWASNHAAISSTGGAMSWQTEWNEKLKTTDLVSGFRIVYDRDAAGAQGTFRVWNSLQESGINASVGALPINYGKDISEYIQINKAFSITPEIRFVKFSSKSLEKNKDAKIDALRKIIREIDVYEKEFPEFWTILQVFRENLVQELRFLQKPKVKLEGTDLKIVKQVPITNYVQFKHGLAPCVFHSDSNPSMVYNPPESQFPNTVKCFSCGHFGSVIDVVMAQNRCDFKAAVDIIKNSSSL